MLLVDATYIHNGGTRVLFDYLIRELTEQKADVYYLIDDRVDTADLPAWGNYKIISGIKYFQRHLFLYKNRNRFSKVFCFNNISPSVRMGGEVITYLQSPFYFRLKVPFSFRERIGFFLRRKFFELTKTYTDKWIVQTNWMKSELSRNYSISNEGIAVLPIMVDVPVTEPKLKVKNTFLYANNMMTHKNHMMLINAFCSFYNMHKQGSLILTGNDALPKVCDFIKQKNREGYPIIHAGFVTNEKLKMYYEECEYYIHPSLAESFGLCLIESIKHGCKLLAADLPYTYEVCKPSAVFDPYDQQDMINVFEKAIHTILPESKVTVHDEMQKLIALLL